MDHVDNNKGIVYIKEKEYIELKRRILELSSENSDIKIYVGDGGVSIRTKLNLSEGILTQIRRIADNYNCKLYEKLRKSDTYLYEIRREKYKSYENAVKECAERFSKLDFLDKVFFDKEEFIKSILE